MVYPDRQRQRQRGRYSKNRSPSSDEDRHRRRSRSRSDSKDRRRSRQHRDYKQKSHHSSQYRSSSDQYDRYERQQKSHDRSHSKKRSQSSQSSSSYPQKQQQQLQHKIRLGIRNNDLHLNKKLYDTFMQLPQRKQQQLAQQARSPQKIHQVILVRQLFISGLNDISEYTITELMGKYGRIENIEIIKDFAFVKYYRVEDASSACADYHNINATAQSLVGANFKIFFADHLKRWNVVSNHPDYQIRELLCPVIYASVKNDPYYANEKYLLPIFKKYGIVRNLEMRKNQFPGPKIHVNVEYETLEMAERARDRIKNHRQKYFGQKRTQITILIDSQKMLRQFPNVQNQIRYQKKRLQTHGLDRDNRGMHQNPNSYTNLNALDSYNPQMNDMGRGPMMNNPMNLMNAPIPPSNSSYQAQDILAMLDKLNEKKASNSMEIQPQEDSDWTGFFTRNNQFKVEVDFVKYHKEVSFELQSILNVSHRGDIHQAINRTDYMLAGKFKASNKLNQEAFQDYIKYFIKKNRAGIIFTNLYLIYLLPPKDDLHLPYKLKQNELLALFFKIKN